MIAPIEPSPQAKVMCEEILVQESPEVWGQPGSAASIEHANPVQRAINRYPLIAVASAVVLGIALGWLVKRRLS